MPVFRRLTFCRFSSGPFVPATNHTAVTVVGLHALVLQPRLQVTVREHFHVKHLFHSQSDLSSLQPFV
jgi:hypothetical protein